MTAIFKIIIFIMSSMGYWELFRRKTQISPYYFPSLTISFQILILFFAGLLNCLFPAAVLLYFVGLLLFVFSLASEKGKQIYPCFLKNPGFWYLLIAGTVCAIALHGRIFEHDDNFSHWALVVKLMLQTNRFPNFQDSIIRFQAYPLGSSVYVYYFCSFTGLSESLQMLAQCYAMLTCFLPLFMFSEKKKWFFLPVLLIFTDFILAYQDTVYMLLVDTMLPLFGIVFFLFYVTQCREKDISAWYAVPYLCTTVLIKNSGIFFSAAALLMLLYEILKDRRQWKKKLVLGVSPFLILYLWNRHCKYVFTNSDESEHAMTASNYIHTILQKSEADIRYIVSAFIKAAFTGRAFSVFLIAFTIVLVIWIIKYRVRLRKCKTLFILMPVLYMLYMIGTAAMYLFSMSLEEAKIMAGFGRYRSTIMIVLYYILMIIVTSIYAKISSHALTCIMFSCMIAGILISGYSVHGYIRTVFSYNTEREGKRRILQNEMQKAGVMPGQNVMVCKKEDDYGYYRLLIQYILLTPSVQQMYITNPSQLDEAAANNQYLCITDKENQIIKNWVKEHYPMQEGNQIIVLSQGEN